MKIFLRSAVSAATLAVLIDREQSRGEGSEGGGRARRANEVESGPKKNSFGKRRRPQVAPVIRDSFFLIGKTERLEGHRTMAGNGAMF